LVCAEEFGAPYCMVACEPSPCEYGEAAGTCISMYTGDEGVCITLSMGSSECRVGTTGCRTEYGVEEGTLCVGDEWGMTYCVETCELVDTGCGSGEICWPLADGGGACFGMWY
jgi:hypothetical protein